MSLQRREGTAPEVALRRALFALGLRYQLHRRPLPELARKADIVFRGAKTAVFVDGCFWHGCPLHGRRQHAVNGWYWPAKIARNQQRDRHTDSALASAGWQVVRFWEHELDGPGAQAAAAQVREVVKSRWPAGRRAERRSRPALPGPAG